MPRRPPRGTECRLYGIGVVPTADEVRLLRELNRSRAEPEALADEAARVIRRVAGRSPFVGPDTLTVIQSPPGNLQVSFRGGSPHSSEFVVRQRIATLPTEYFPWCLGSSGYLASNVHSGTTTAVFPLSDRSRVTLNGSVGVGGLTAMSSQRRPRWP